MINPLEKKWTIQKEYEHMSVRDYLRSVQSISRRMLKLLKVTEQGILVNGQEVTVQHILQKNDMLRVKLPPEVRATNIISEEIPLHIVYEDEAMLVLNKQAGIATIPSRNETTGTLVNGILHHYEMHKLPYTVHIVTRLDRDTSGLVLVAKHRYSHAKFAEIQQRNELFRRYHAFVRSDGLQSRKRIEAPIGRADDSIISREVREDGQYAATSYEVVQKFRDYALIDVILETGRTHQIRVHLSHIGFPLVGDTLYGGKEVKPFKRQALHCSELSFAHPFTNEKLYFKTALPESFKTFIQENS